MRCLYVCLVAATLVFLGCDDEFTLIDITPVDKPPSFTQQVNEIQISTSMNDVDPSWVLGSIVNLKTGEVRGMDNYLVPNAEPLITPQTEVVFRNIIENSLAVEGSWLGFLSSSLSKNVRAELSVIKASKSTIRNQDVDEVKLMKELRTILLDQRADYGLIIGYVDFVLSATLYRDLGAEGSASGYGAKIGGKWYTKQENTSAQHRVVAAFSPLPFIEQILASNAAPDSSLEKATLTGIESGAVQIKPVVKKPDFKTYLQKKKIPG